MADINRLPLAALLPFALVALTACGSGSEPAVEQAAEAMATQPAAPAEGAAQPDAVQLSQTDDGGVEIRKVEEPAGQAAEAAPAEPAH